MKPGHDCDHTHLTAAWVLGTLTPAEAERFAAHLAACVVCQAEVASLRDAADAMADAVPAVAPPPGVSARLMAAVGREAELFRAASAQEAYAASTRRPRRRLRRGALLAVAAVSLFVGGSILGGVLDGPENLRPASRTIAGTVALAAGGPGAEAEIMVRGDDTALVLSNVDPPAEGRIYQAWLERSPSVAVATGALFSVGTSGDTTIRLPSLRGAQRMIVTSEPSSGSTVPTLPPVMVVDLSAPGRTSP